MSTFFLYLVLSLPYVGVYAMLGLGITTIYQASRVLNLAHGAMAMGAAYFTYQLARWHTPVPAAVVGGLVFGGGLGLLVERVFVRRLRSAGPTTQTVGTVAFLTLAIAVAARIFGSLPVIQVHVLPKGALQLGHGHVDYALLGIFPIGVIGAFALFALLQFTDIGLAMRGAAQNRRGAALRGVDPDRTTALAWLVGGAYAGLAGVLLSSATVLDPYEVSLGVLPAFVAALIGGLDSMLGVLLGAVIVGIVQGMVPFFGSLPKFGAVDTPSILGAPGAPQLVLAVLALAVMAMRGARFAAGDTRGDTL